METQIDNFEKAKNLDNKISERSNGEEVIQQQSLRSSSNDETRKKVLNNEIQILKTLDHPNIIKYYESFVYKKHLCIITEYAQSGDLQKKLKEAKNGQRKISKQQILDWFCQLSLAIGHIHSKNILHRDLKPKNILLTKDNQVKIGDFGISKMLENTFDMAKTATGTPYYLSPEVCLGQKYDHKSDMWMLGCILYELCTLRRPFEGDSLNQVLNKITKVNHQNLGEEFNPLFHRLIDLLLYKSASLRASITEILEIPEIQQNIKSITKMQIQKADKSTKELQQFTQNAILTNKNQEKERMNEQQHQKTLKESRQRNECEGRMNFNGEVTFGDEYSKKEEKREQPKDELNIKMSEEYCGYEQARHQYQKARCQTEFKQYQQSQSVSSNINDHQHSANVRSTSLNHRSNDESNMKIVQGVYESNQSNPNFKNGSFISQSSDKNHYSKISKKQQIQDLLNKAKNLTSPSQNVLGNNEECFFSEAKNGLSKDGSAKYNNKYEKKAVEIIDFEYLQFGDFANDNHEQEDTEIWNSEQIGKRKTIHSISELSNNNQRIMRDNNKVQMTNEQKEKMLQDNQSSIQVYKKSQIQKNIYNSEINDVSPQEKQKPLNNSLLPIQSSNITFISDQARQKQQISNKRSHQQIQKQMNLDNQIMDEYSNEFQKILNIRKLSSLSKKDKQLLLLDGYNKEQIDLQISSSQESNKIKIQQQILGNQSTSSRRKVNNLQKQIGQQSISSNAPKSNHFMNKTPSVNTNQKQAINKNLKKKIQINTNLEPSQSKKQLELALVMQQNQYYKNLENQKILKNRKSGVEQVSQNSFDEQRSKNSESLNDINKKLNQSSISCGNITLNFNAKTNQNKIIQQNLKIDNQKNNFQINQSLQKIKNKNSSQFQQQNSSTQQQNKVQNLSNSKIMKYQQYMNNFEKNTEDDKKQQILNQNDKKNKIMQINNQMIIVDEQGEQFTQNLSQISPGSFYTPNSFYKKPGSLYNRIAAESDLSINNNKSQADSVSSEILLIQSKQQKQQSINQIISEKNKSQFLILPQSNIQKSHPKTITNMSVQKQRKLIMIQPVQLQLGQQNSQDSNDQLQFEQNETQNEFSDKIINNNSSHKSTRTNIDNNCHLNKNQKTLFVISQNPSPFSSLKKQIAKTPQDNNFKAINHLFNSNYSGSGGVIVDDTKQDQPNFGQPHQNLNNEIVDIQQNELSKKGLQLKRKQVNTTTNQQIINQIIQSQQRKKEVVTSKSGVIQHSLIGHNIYSNQTKQNAKNQSNLKYFTFDQNGVIFNPKNPDSPARGHLATEFLKQKLGKQRYEQILNIINNSENPLRLLDISKDILNPLNQQIIENSEYGRNGQEELKNQNIDLNQLQQQQQQIMLLMNNDKKYLQIFQLIVNCSITSNSMKTMKSVNTNSSFYNQSSLYQNSNLAKDGAAERKSLANTPNSIYTSDSNQFSSYGNGHQQQALNNQNSGRIIPQQIKKMSCDSGQYSGENLAGSDKSGQTTAGDGFQNQNSSASDKDANNQEAHLQSLHDNNLDNTKMRKEQNIKVDNQKKQQSGLRQNIIEKYRKKENQINEYKSEIVERRSNDDNKSKQSFTSLRQLFKQRDISIEKYRIQLPDSQQESQKQQNYQIHHHHQLTVEEQRQLEYSPYTELLSPTPTNFQNVQKYFVNKEFSSSKQI